MKNRTHRTYLAAPGYGHQTAAAGRGLWRARADMSKVSVAHLNSSLLAANFNGCWCAALNEDHRSEGIDYFAMLHSDIGPQDFWLDVLISEMEERNLDILGVPVPIKDQRGLTSLAIDGDTTWHPQRRITMTELAKLPQTFTSEDVGGPLLLNTGCWVCRFDATWARKVHFTINDRIVFNKATGLYHAECEPEDWYFSRLCHELGLKIGATRKVEVMHRGEIDFSNQTVWGNQFDSEYGATGTFIEGSFPDDVEGWLHPDEGRALTELCEGKDVLEIGSYAGLSTICIARRATSVTCVDYWDGRATPEPKSTWRDFVNNITRHGVADKIKMQAPGDPLPAGFFDVVFIDGDHSLEAVRDDIETATNALKPDGLIVFHDYQSPEDLEVTQAVDELIGRGGELIEQTNTVAVVRPPVFVPTS